MLQAVQIARSSLQAPDALGCFTGSGKMVADAVCGQGEEQTGHTLGSNQFFQPDTPPQTYIRKMAGIGNPLTARWPTKR